MTQLRILPFLLWIFSTSLVAADKFRVCADPLNPPYSTKEQTGYENKIAQLFADQLGQELEYYWFPQRIGFIRNTLKSEIEGTDQFKCDVVIGVPTGFDFAKTTKPYFHSTYTLLIAKGRGWDHISQPEQLADLPLQKQEKLKIAMFDRGPGTAWLQKYGLLDQGIPYQSMTGDDENNVAMQIEKDLKAGKIDMVILWGPLSGYITSQSPEGSYTVLPMQSSPDIKFDFSMSMAVRYGDNDRKTLLDNLIDQHRDEIAEILKSYDIPVLPIPEQTKRQDDD
jgi:quinoprotein dehydrogenase-associated probable ABC transporter substrate-binding protein